MLKAELIEFPGQLKFHSASSAAVRAISVLKITRIILVLASVYAVVCLIFDIQPYFHTDINGKINETVFGSLIVFICSLTLLCAGLFYIIWSYKAYRNLPALGSSGLHYSPKWAVLGFLIPILNLFIPFYIAADVWRGSRPEVLPDDIGTSWEHMPIPGEVRIWWLFHILAMIVIPSVACVIIISGNSKSLPDLLNIVQTAITVSYIISTHYAIAIVKQSNQRQADRYDEIEIKDIFTRKAVCPVCKAELRTKTAKQCPNCYLDWHDINNPKYLDGKNWNPVVLT